MCSDGGLTQARGVPEIEGRDDQKLAVAAARATSPPTMSHLDARPGANHGGSRGGAGGAGSGDGGQEGGGGRLPKFSHLEDACGGEGRTSCSAYTKNDADLHSPTSPPTPSLSLASPSLSFSLLSSASFLTPRASRIWHLQGRSNFWSGTAIRTWMPSCPILDLCIDPALLTASVSDPTDS